VLGARGLSVEVAGSGAEALQRLTEDAAPAAIVADIGLPDLSGPELIERLRKAAPSSALVVLTGENDEKTKRDCLGAGASAYLIKPLTGGQLHAALHEACG